MINSANILNSFTENRLNEIVDKLMWFEIINYQWEKYETAYLNNEECEKYILDTLVLPSLDVKTCIEKLKIEIEKNKHNAYEKNLCTKKLVYFNILYKFNENLELYNILTKINWYVLRIKDNTEWNDFTSMISGEKNIHNVINTRPTRGFKPNKISSKIIYNRNG
ncbi:MAG: hypothetical protein ACK4YD_05600 [Chitinophagia bacterium]|jgi:hypothetical protein